MKNNNNKYITRAIQKAIFNYSTISSQGCQINWKKNMPTINLTSHSKAFLKKSHQNIQLKTRSWATIFFEEIIPQSQKYYFTLKRRCIWIQQLLYQGHIPCVISTGKQVHTGRDNLCCIKVLKCQTGLARNHNVIAPCEVSFGAQN